MPGAMDLSRMDFIAAPTKDPRATIQQGSNVVATILNPVIVAALECQRLVGAAALFLCIRGRWLALHMLCTSQIVASQAYVSSRFVWQHLRLIQRVIWEARAVRRLRKKIAFEFITLMLGSGGNSLCLVIFWPGWWVLGLIVWGVQWYIG